MFVLLNFSAGHSIYGFELPLWYLQTLLIMLLLFFFGFIDVYSRRENLPTVCCLRYVRYVLLTVYNDKISFIKHTNSTIDFCKWLIRSDYIKINTNNYRDNIRSLFVFLYFFFWPWRCLFFFDIRILIIPLVSSNSSVYMYVVRGI